jgi:hypothetical protein
MQRSCACVPPVPPPMCTMDGAARPLPPPASLPFPLAGAGASRPAGSSPAPAPAMSGSVPLPSPSLTSVAVGGSGLGPVSSPACTSFVAWMSSTSRQPANTSSAHSTHTRWPSSARERSLQGRLEDTVTIGSLRSPTLPTRDASHTAGLSTCKSTWRAPALPLLAARPALRGAALAFTSFRPTAASVGPAC